MKKIIYTVQFKNSCKKPIKKLIVLYEGEQLEPAGEMNLSHVGGASLTMLMIIPKIATVSWSEENGTPHEYQVPLASKIKTSDILGSGFTIVFSVCDADLTVYFDKDVGQFESKRKTLWSSKNPTP